MTNAENVDKTTNPSFKNPRAPFVEEIEAEFVLVLKNQYASVSLCSQQLTKIRRSLCVKYSNGIDQGNRMRRRLHTLKYV